MLHESHLETHVNCGDFDPELMEADVQGAQGDRLEHKPQIRCMCVPSAEAAAGETPDDNREHEHD